MSPIAAPKRQMKTSAKVGILGVAIVLVFFTLNFAVNHGWINPPGVLKTVMVAKVSLPELRESGAPMNVKALPFPSSKPCSVQATKILGEIWEWNAQINLLYANGGSETTCGSLMEKHKVNLHLTRQDDTVKMQEDLIACANEIRHGSSECTQGANFVIVMGDGSPKFFSNVNSKLKKLGPEYQAVIIGATGYSRGEDKFMAPPAVKKNAQAARGLLVAGVIMDGDWNIALNWASSNQIPNNPDEHTYDPDALNWVNTAGCDASGAICDYIRAAAVYNDSQCEDRKVVKDGRLTGETKHVCVNGVVTWTPGDDQIAKGKGGLVKIASSKEYRSQMPAVIIGSKKFFKDNREETENFLAAIFEAADQIKTFPDALKRAGDISAKIYNDNSLDWAKYYKGLTIVDSQGLQVEVGGSSVNNLADNRLLFGLDGPSSFASVYNVFARIDSLQYPAIFKDSPIPDPKEIVDVSFLKGAGELINSSTTTSADVAQFNGEEGSELISRAKYSVNFDTGRSTIKPDGQSLIHGLKDQLVVNDGLFITIEGHTDNTGNPQTNEALSQARAEAVKRELQRLNSREFPDTRFRVVGYGDTQPVASNSTEQGKAQNRRVEIKLTN